jgi:cytochrome c553
VGFSAHRPFSCVVFPQERIQLCVACHGPDGNSLNPVVPSIVGQPKLFIENQLILFREELRNSDQMLPVVKGLKDAEIVKLAEHFSKLPAKAMEAGPADAALMNRGIQKAKELRCGICHLSDFSGQNQIPRAAGQREAYLEAEMRAYRDGKRTGGDTIMAAALYGVSDADIKALAHYLSRSSARSRAR